MSSDKVNEFSTCFFLSIFVIFVLFLLLVFFGLIQLLINIKRLKKKKLLVSYHLDVFCSKKKGKRVYRYSLLVSQCNYYII